MKAFKESSTYENLAELCSACTVSLPAAGHASAGALIKGLRMDDIWSLTVDRPQSRPSASVMGVTR